MPTNGGGIGPIKVRCPDYTKRFKTIEAAQAWRDRVESTGACHHVHEVIALDTTNQGDR